MCFWSTENFTDDAHVLTFASVCLLFKTIIVKNAIYYCKLLQNNCYSVKHKPSNSGDQVNYLFM